MPSWNERELEDWLYKNPSAIGISQWIGRQIDLPSGRLDLIGINSSGCVVVVELKAVPIDSSAILQCCRYAKDIAHIWGSEPDKVVIGVGQPPSVIQHEADSVDVELISVGFEFSFEGPWRFTEQAEQGFADKRQAAVKQMPLLLGTLVAQELCKFIYQYSDDLVTSQRRGNLLLGFLKSMDSRLGAHHSYIVRAARNVLDSMWRDEVLEATKE